MKRKFENQCLRNCLKVIKEGIIEKIIYLVANEKHLFSIQNHEIIIKYREINSSNSTIRSYKTAHKQLNDNVRNRFHWIHHQYRGIRKCSLYAHRDQ